MMDAISVERKNMRQKVAGSRKYRIPITVTPMAPIPVHTAYAVPIGSVCAALYNNDMDKARQNKNAINQIVDS